MKGNILIAEDDFDIADLIRMYLENSGYQVFLAENGEKALEVMEQTPIDLAILDVMMPRMDGFALTRKIRETSGIPLIILSAKGKEEDRVRGLETGADVYMTKPFQPRRPGGTGTGQSAAGGSLFQPGTCAGTLAVRRWTVGGSGKPDRFQKRGNTAPDLHGAEAAAQTDEISGRVFTKAQLYSCLNGEGLRSDDNTIMVHISNLREKIEEDPRRPALIRTIRGIGYKFDGNEKKINSIAA